MTYATQDDLVSRYGEQELILLTDSQNSPPSVVDADVVSQKLLDVDSEINGYLAARYTVPLDPAPRVLVKVACALCRYYLHADNAPSRVQSDYEDAEAWLKAVAAGQVSLGDATSAPAASAGGGPQISTPCRTFTKNTLKAL
jgi:phage gp36-like protein